jgi:hypothetical protein
MDCRRFPGRLCLVVVIMSLAITVTAGGCVGGLTTAMWLIKGPNIDAEFDVLREKKVVVVCRPLDFSQYRNPTVPKDVARGVGKLVQQNVPKIEVIDQRKVDEWMDNNSWDEYLEVGKALDADLIVGMDLESFGIYESQTLYKGMANVNIKVIDCHTGEVIVDKTLPQSVYPPNSFKTTDEMQEAEFRREFVTVLTDQIARHFYSHDPRAYFAADAKAIQR